MIFEMLTGEMLFRADMDGLNLREIVKAIGEPSHNEKCFLKANMSALGIAVLEKSIESLKMERVRLDPLCSKLVRLNKGLSPTQAIQAAELLGTMLKWVPEDRARPSNLLQKPYLY